jgi:hypothetical protein
MKEKLQEYALIAEIISAIAIVVSLIFVGLQIRDNTIASEAATYQDSVAYDVEILTMLGSNPDASRIWNAYSRNNPDGLTTDEIVQAQFIMSATVRLLENYYIQNESGMLSDAGWGARDNLVRNFVQMPGFEKFLSSPNVLSFSGSFMEYAKSIRAESSSNAN